MAGPGSSVLIALWMEKTPEISYSSALSLARVMVGGSETLRETTL